ncbi:hypothetical protein B0T10DRAFT_76705 [Thelonectria olida]|uniref:BHLH domain-containing protein n=1 Tax=Thelonectria olida TaxID=1576542 RepID=A0A9P8W3I8_9HYPO|nr:hypothetical protein B0T10DRAFT_76705 [Thelonectria olida]
MLAAARKELLTASRAGTSATRMEANGASSKRVKKRVRKFTSDDRAAHRIFERSRREAFKEKLNELAGHLPALADSDPQRLSKHVVVEEGIARCQTLHRQCLDALSDIRALIQERDELLAEVNTRRHAEGTPLRLPKAVDLHIDGLVELETEASHLAAVRRPSASQTQSRSPDEEGTDGQEHSNDDAVTTQDLAPNSTLSLPQSSVVQPLLVPEANDESMLLWGLASQDPIPAVYLDPSSRGNMCPSQDATSISEFAHSGPFPLSFNASLDFLDVEDPLTHQDFPFFDADSVAIHLQPRGAGVQAGVSLSPGYPPESEVSQLGAGIS